MGPRCRSDVHVHVSSVFFLCRASCLCVARREQGEEPSVEVLKKCIRTGTLDNVFVPVLTGTAFKNKGVQPLLDAVVDFMPSPIEVEAIKGVSVSKILKAIFMYHSCYILVIFRIFRWLQHIRHAGP